MTALDGVFLAVYRVVGAKWLLDTYRSAQLSADPEQPFRARRGTSAVVQPVAAGGPEPDDCGIGFWSANVQPSHRATTAGAAQ